MHSIHDIVFTGSAAVLRVCIGSLVAAKWFITADVVRSVFQNEYVDVKRLIQNTRQSKHLSLGSSTSGALASNNIACLLSFSY
jgi:hypothetical protein